MIIIYSAKLGLLFQFSCGTHELFHRRYSVKCSTNDVNYPTDDEINLFHCRPYLCCKDLLVKICLFQLVILKYLSFSFIIANNHVSTKSKRRSQQLCFFFRHPNGSFFKRSKAVFLFHRQLRPSDAE